jgi:hypothetical protein
MIELDKYLRRIYAQLIVAQTYELIPCFTHSHTLKEQEEVAAILREQTGLKIKIEQNKGIFSCK